MALPKGVKSPVDYRDLYLSNELEGEVIDEKIGEYIKSAGKFLKDKALPALSKTPMGAKFAIPVVGSLLAGRGLINARKSAIDKNVDKYVRDRRIKGGPKKIDPSSFNAPHHVDDMKTERPKREPMKPKTREELGLRGVNAKVRPVKDGKKVDINKTYIKNLDYKTQMYKEATMTPAQKRKDTMLKKKYEKSDDMMKSFKDQYGKEKGENVFYAFIRKKSMEEENIHEILDKKDVPHIKKLIKKLKDGSELHAKQSKDLEKVMKEQLGGTGPKVAPSSEEMKKKLKQTADVQTAGTIKKPTVVMPDGMELPGLQGGGGGTNAITDKSQSKSLVKRVNDVGKMLTRPFRKVQKDPTEKFATEDTAIESELVIQDWNVDDIKFTEIETVDIIKAKPLKESMSNWREDLGEDWQKVNRKDKTDGLSRKAVKAYRRENPGSKLQTAVTKDPKKLKKGSKSAKRRLSFCRRMKGMKKKLTSAKTRRDPDSRINKALRRWNC